MNKRKSFIKPGIILIIFTMALLLGCPSNQEQRQSRKGSIDFTLNTIEGQEISLKDYQGKKIVHLVFWATWCPSCIMEIPKLKKLQQAIGNKPYEILAIDVGVNDSLKKVKSFQKRYQMSYKVLFDEKGDVSRKYGVMGIPTQIIIDKKGNIQDQFTQLPEDLKGYLNQFFPS
jgi:peroxiredoxin